MLKSSPTMLIILDGFGIANRKKGNAILNAKMPIWRSLLKNYPNTKLKASGEAVGLPKGYMGNSEVGHLTIGAGRIIQTVLKKFNKSIKNGSFFKNKILIKDLKKIKQNNALHIMGLLSDAGVHSHQDHLYAIIELAKKLNLKNVFIHPFLDGRDVGPKSATKYLAKLQRTCDKYKFVKIASIHGRFYAMDRDKNWNRTKESYDILCNIKIKIKFSSWQEALKNSYKKNITDEFFVPTRLLQAGRVKKGDGIIFFNFRPDRARQLTKYFLLKNKNFKFFISTTRYKKRFEKFNNDILFKEDEIKNTLLDVIAKKKNPKNVFVIAETEKYAHVTYFFNGMREKKRKNEKRILINSLKVKSYDQAPEMSAKKITNSLIKSLKEDSIFFYLVNYANPDMVAHSGNIKATIKACEFLDKQLKSLHNLVVKKMNGTLFITSDHGNAEGMLDSRMIKAKTSHTKNPVPFVFINKKVKNKKLKQKKGLGLSNIAPTIIKFLDLKIPSEMNKKTIF